MTTQTQTQTPKQSLERALKRIRAMGEEIQGNIGSGRISLNDLCACAWAEWESAKDAQLINADPHDLLWAIADVSEGEDYKYFVELRNRWGQEPLSDYEDDESY